MSPYSPILQWDLGVLWIVVSSPWRGMDTFQPPGRSPFALTGLTGFSDAGYSCTQLLLINVHCELVYLIHNPKTRVCIVIYTKSSL